MEQNILYRNHRIRIIQDSDPMNPRTDWDNLGTIAANHRNYTLEDKGFDMDGDELREHFTRSMLADLYSNALYLMEYGSSHDQRERSPERWETLNEWLKDQVRSREDAYIEAKYTYLPVYAYEHGGITLSTGSFECNWDSGQVGMIFCSLEDARNEWGTSMEWDDVLHGGVYEGKTLREHVIQILKSEIETYSQYLEGDVYGYIIEEAAGIVPDEDLDEDDNELWDNELDSCWGFYGDEGVKEAIEQAKHSIDYHLDTHLPEQARKLAEMEASIDKIWAQ